MGKPNFGDAQLNPRVVLGKVVLRLFLMLPVGAIGAVLCATGIGAVLGVPLLLCAGAFISKPIRKHPKFNVDNDG